MARTLIKSRLHSNKQKPKIKQEVNNTIKLNQKYHHICNHLNKNYYPEVVLLNINSFINCDYFKLYHQNNRCISCFLYSINELRRFPTGR